MELIKQITFENILQTDYDVLREASWYNFKLKGKNFWSCIIMLLSWAMYSKWGSLEDFYKTEEYEISCLLSACVEIAHNSSLLQDDIIDKAENWWNSPAAYKVFGKSNSVFASNFLIAWASGILAWLEKSYLSQIFSSMLYNLVHGELIQAKQYQDSEDELFLNYITKSYFKTASLMSLACRGVGIIHKLPLED